MEIKYSPQANNNVHRSLAYVNLGDKLKVIYNECEIEEIIDIENVLKNQNYEPRFLPFNPIANVKRDGNNYIVTVIRLYGQDEKEKFEHR